MKSRFSPIAILGPTASGKSELALALATRLDGEIVSCDSVQFYKGFDIGSAKPSLQDRARIPHHFLDTLESHDDYDAHRYAQEARAVLREIQDRQRTPILCGGTGLYFRALCSDRFHDGIPSHPGWRKKMDVWDRDRLLRVLKRIDPERAKKIHPNDRYRLMRAIEVRLQKGPGVELPLPHVQNPFFTVIVDWPRDVLRERIAARTKSLFENGLVREVESLLARGVSPLAKPMQSIGYRQVGEMLKGCYDVSECQERVFFATCQYAKRQQNWFRNVHAQLRVTEWEPMIEEYQKWQSGSELGSQSFLVAEPSQNMITKR